MSAPANQTKEVALADDGKKKQIMEALEVEDVKTEGPKKLFFLEPRDIGVTRANMCVFFLFYFMNSLMGFVNSFMVFFIEEALKVNK